MKDGRTPRQLGEALAEAMLSKHPDKALPQSFVMSSDFDGFCRGRNFTETQRIQCEKAYQQRYEDLQ